MKINFQYSLLKMQGIAFFFMLIILPACFPPYSVPEKEKGEEDTRVIFEDMEKEKNIQDNEAIVEIVEEQKVKVENLLNNDLNLVLLNRLSDLLFILARYVDKDNEYIRASE